MSCPYRSTFVHPPCAIGFILFTKHCLHFGILGSNLFSAPDVSAPPPTPTHYFVFDEDECLFAVPLLEDPRAEELLQDLEGS